MNLVYDPRGLTWPQWCALMSERFAANQLGTVPEADWRKWADGIAGIGRFPGVPGGAGFVSWQEWAFAFNNILRK
jgi:hypothetical protein